MGFGGLGFNVLWLNLLSRMPSYSAYGTTVFPEKCYSNEVAENTNLVKDAYNEKHCNGRAPKVVTP